MQRVFRYKLYPSSEQDARLQQHLETLRHLYNNSLAERLDAWKHEKRSIGYYEQQSQLPPLKKKAALLKDVFSQCAQDCLRG